MSRRHLSLTLKVEALSLLAAGRTSRQVAAAIGIDKATVNRWARGAVRPLEPTPEAGPCEHTCIEARRGTYTCRACGIAIPQSSPLSFEATPPEWARTRFDHERPPVVVHQPVWRSA